MNGFNFSKPLNALTVLIFPSNANGVVTIATVMIPFFLASSAITGIAPVPVPPPSPAVKNSRSAPSIALSIRSMLSLAAFSPISGLAPAPLPLVSSFPI